MVITLIAGGDFLSPRFAAASRESARRNAYALSMALEAAGFNVRGFTTERFWEEANRFDSKRRS